jgi:hypothetical protein
MSAQQQGGGQQQAPAPTQQAPQAPTAQAEPQAPTAQAEPTASAEKPTAPTADAGQDYGLGKQSDGKFIKPNQKFDTASGEKLSLPAPTQQAPAAPADNVSTTSSTGGQTSQTPTGQVHKANPNNPNQPAPAPVAGQPPDLKMIQGGKGTAADPNNIAARKAALAQSKADRAAGKGVTGAIRTGTLGEGAEFYSKFFKKMI